MISKQLLETKPLRSLRPLRGVKPPGSHSPPNRPSAAAQTDRKYQTCFGILCSRQVTIEVRACHQFMSPIHISKSLLRAKAGVLLSSSGATFRPRFSLPGDRLQWGNAKGNSTQKWISGSYRALHLRIQIRLSYPYDQYHAINRTHAFKSSL